MVAGGVPPDPGAGAPRGDAAPDAPARAIVDHQPVGTLIVDEQTVVMFANPAAAEMLRVPRERLVGEVFGLPLTTGGVTDVNVPDEDDSVQTLAMRTTKWTGGEGKWLVTLFDVSGRARLYEHEHRLVESLQRSLLLERMPALDSSRWRPATSRARGRCGSAGIGMTPSLCRTGGSGWRSVTWRATASHRPR